MRLISDIPGQAIPISSLSKTSQSSGTTQNTTTLENAKPSTHEQDVELDLQTTQDEENYTDVRYNLYAMSVSKPAVFCRYCINF